jgi:threonine dehydrogenase-like Zn-dependent dehydrogenase
MAETMRAAVFEGRERIVIAEKPVPECGLSDAIVRLTLTTVCGTDVHGRLDLGALVTHRFSLDQIEEANELLGNQRGDVVKVALVP